MNGKNDYVFIAIFFNTSVYSLLVFYLSLPPISLSVFWIISLLMFVFFYFKKLQKNGDPVCIFKKTILNIPFITGYIFLVFPFSCLFFTSNFLKIQYSFVLSISLVIYLSNISWFIFVTSVPVHLATDTLLLVISFIKLSFMVRRFITTLENEDNWVYLFNNG